SLRDAPHHEGVARGRRGPLGVLRFRHCEVAWMGLLVAGNPVHTRPELGQAGRSAGRRRALGMAETTVGAVARPQSSFQDVLVVSFGHALTHWYPATFYLLLPLIGSELGLSYAQVGSILTAQFAAGAIANVPGGIFVDTVGRKGLLMAISL